MSRGWGVGCADCRVLPTLRTRLPRRPQAVSVLVCEVPPAGWRQVQKKLGRRGPVAGGRPPATSRTGCLRTGCEDAREGCARHVGWARAHRGVNALAGALLLAGIGHGPHD